MAGKTRYDAFAWVADEYWQSFGPEFSVLILPRIIRFIRFYQVYPRTLLDLGCGTGSFAIAMAARGLEVTGLDSSRVALKLAQRKASLRKLSIRWWHGDMRQFRLKRKFDLATALFNSVNHLLSERDLKAMFASIHCVLRPGGYFIFDLNHKECFEQVWGGASVVHGKEFVLFRRDQISQRQRRASAKLLIFRKRGSHVVCETDCIEERWFSERIIRQAIRQSGLQEIAKENFNPFLKKFKYSPNIKSLWLLRRPDN